MGSVSLVLILLVLSSCTCRSAVAGGLGSDFQELNVEEAIAGTKHRETSFQEQEQEEEQGKWKLELVHRDRLVDTQSHSHSDSHKDRFNARMKRDVKRVGSLLRRLNKTKTYRTEEASFGSDVVPGAEEGSGEYFVRIGIGSPATYQYMVIDSGSDIVWVQCQPCHQCYNQSDPIFNPVHSASYSPLSCSSAVCDQLDDAACHRGSCRYQVSYGDGSYTKGTLALETITLGRTLIRNTAIGCGHWNQGMFVGAAGLLGLGAGPMSFVGQLGGQTGGAFAYCLLSRGTATSSSSSSSSSSGSGSGSGSLEFGRQAMAVGAAWVPLVQNPFFPSFYYVALSGLGVGGSRLNISEDVFGVTELGDGGAVMDTGTAVTRLPTLAYNAFRDAFLAQTTNLPRAPAGGGGGGRISIFDTCYDLNGFVTVRVPTVSFYFEGGQILTLPATNFLIPTDDVGTFCFAFAPSPSTLSIIGNIQQQGIQISVDAANGFLGFGPNVC